jgi:hypothetical protein
LYKSFLSTKNKTTTTCVDNQTNIFLGFSDEVFASAVEMRMKTISGIININRWRKYKIRTIKPLNDKKKQ